LDRELSIESNERGPQAQCSLTNELAKVDCSFDIAQRIVGVVFFKLFAVATASSLNVCPPESLGGMTSASGANMDAACTIFIATGRELPPVLVR
jgi:hypothetical protein